MHRGEHHAGHEHLYAMHHLRQARQYAFLGNSHADHSQHTSSSNVHVGAVNVHTQATDARGIARDMRQAMNKELLSEQANTGLA